MGELSIEEGFNEDEREIVVDLFREAFGRKFRPGFADEATARRVLLATLRSDRVLVARRAGELLGVCGFHQERVGSIDLSWSRLRGTISFLAYLRALLVLAIISTEDQADALVLDGIAVSGAARGQGIGTALLNEAAGRARSAGFRALKLSVVDSNPRAQALYEREGFAQVKRGSIGFLSGIYGFSGYITMERSV